MQKTTQLFVIFLVAALLTVGIASLLGTRIGGDGGRPGAGAEPGSAATQPPPTAERLREVQDAYLRILREHPNDAAALRGLIVVRRYLAGDDPVVLRRQAVAYQQLAASGVDSPEHYSPQVMRVLAAASLQAAAAVESEQRIAQRSSRPGPPDKGGFTPPALPGPPVQTGKGPPHGSVPAAPPPSKGPATVSPGQPSESTPVQPGAPPPATAQAPTGPPPPSQSTPQPPAAAPQAPSVPATGITTSQQPPAGQAPTGPGSPEGTIAVVPPTASGPGVVSSEGNLASVDCQNKSFVIHGANGDEEYLTAPSFTIYVRGPVPERLSDFCGLRRHLGRAAMVWSVADGDRKIAKSMSVVLPPQ